MMMSTILIQTDSKTAEPIDISEKKRFNSLYQIEKASCANTQTHRIINIDIIKTLGSSFHHNMLLPSFCVSVSSLTECRV